MTTVEAGPRGPEQGPWDSASTVGAALVPVGVHTRASEGVEAVLHQLEAPGVTYVAVTEHDGAPVGVITREDIDQLRGKHPDYWSAMRCGNAIVAPARFLDAGEPFDAAVEMLREEGIRPLLVLEGDQIAGVLEPTTVFQWCAEHRPGALEALAQLARRPAADNAAEN